MRHDSTTDTSPGDSDQAFEERIRRALATPPISNEEISRRSKLGGKAEALPRRRSLEKDQNKPC
jgi:hypothetical protein